MIMRCLLACNKPLPSSDPQIRFEQVQNAPSDSAGASLNPTEERHVVEKDTPKSYTQAGWQDFEAQHPLGPFIAVSRSHESLVNNDQPHQTPSTSSGSGGLPLSKETDQIEHAMFWGAQEVSVLESPGALTTYVLTDLIISSRRQCTTDYKTRRRRTPGGAGQNRRHLRKKPMQ